MARIQANLRVTNKSCRRSHCIIDTYQLIHQRRFPLVSNLDKHTNKGQKMYPLVQNKFLVMTYLKGFWALKITSNCLKKKKHYSNQKNFKRFPQNPGNHYQKGYQQHQNSNHYRNRPDSRFKQKGKFPKKHN